LVFHSLDTGYMAASLYNRDGQHISSAALDGLISYPMAEPVWYEEYGGYVFTLIDESGQDQLLFWDAAHAGEGESLKLTTAEEALALPAGSSLPEEYYARAQALSEKYGIRILIGDQCDTDFNERTAMRREIAADVDLALNELEAALSAYPEGFIDQLKFESYTEIEIQLLGEILDKFNNDLLNGFVEYHNGKFVMGLDARGPEIAFKPLRQTFHHEISHIVDYKLEMEAAFVDNGYSDAQWRKFNPEGFIYKRDSDSGINMYQDYPDCFIDAYSATASSEDRARILEYASFNDWTRFENSQILKDKLAYYTQCIRRGFDTTGWPEKTIWENTPWS